MPPLAFSDLHARAGVVLGGGRGDVKSPNYEYTALSTVPNGRLCELLYVLLTVRLVIILVNNQPDAQFLFLYLFIPILYMFRAPSADHQEGQLYQYGVCHCM